MNCIETPFKCRKCTLSIIRKMRFDGKNTIIDCPYCKHENIISTMTTNTANSDKVLYLKPNKFNMTQIKSFLHKGFEIEPIGEVKENHLVKISGDTFLGYQYQGVTLEDAVNGAKKHIDEYFDQTVIMYKGYELRILDEHEGKVRLFIPDSEFEGKAYGFGLYDNCLLSASIDIDNLLRKTQRKSKTEYWTKARTPKDTLIKGALDNMNYIYVSDFKHFNHVCVCYKNPITDTYVFLLNNEPYGPIITDKDFDEGKRKMMQAVNVMDGFNKAVSTNLSLFDIYKQWLKETNRGGSVLLGKSVREFIEYAQSKIA